MHALAAVAQAKRVAMRKSFRFICQKKGNGRRRGLSGAIGGATAAGIGIKSYCAMATRHSAQVLRRTVAFDIGEAGDHA
jgi:hypothetical protein